MPPYDMPDDLRARLIALMEQCLDLLEAPSMEEREKASTDAINFMIGFHKIHGRWPFWYEIFEGAKTWKGEGF